MRMLIVEDDFICRHILKESLAPYGGCDIAVDGDEAVQAFRLSWEENKPYDLICMDIMMPKVDGMEALSQIRRLEALMGIKKPSRVKVIMVTAIDDVNNMVKAINGKGANYYMVKPINKEKLIKLLTSMNFKCGS
ncbi:MAG: response regulator [bacterium]